MESSTARTGTIVAISAGTILAGLVGYAAYFDHKRRSDPEFRKSLKRESKRQAKAQKAAQEQEAKSAEKEIMKLVRDANAEGYPEDTEEREKFFLENMQKGEELIGMGKAKEGAVCLFKTLKVYPAKGDLIRMFDQTIPKDILDILAVMIASDPAMASDDMDAVA